MSDATKSLAGEIMGPIFAAWARDLHVHLATLSSQAPTSALFCARGGLRMRAVYETWLARLGLPPSASLADLMASRLTCARLSATDPLTVSAIDRVIGDLAPDRMARILYPGLPDGVDMPDAATGGAAIAAFLGSDSEPARLASAWISDQGSMLRKHIRDIAPDARNLAIVDTGLRGTIVELLAPHFESEGRRVIGLLYGRASRGPTPPHFAFTHGLGFEIQMTHPLVPESAFLRHWHAIEAAFEPDLPSVREYSLQDGKVVSNLEIEGWRDRVSDRSNAAFDGVMDYLESAPLEALIAPEESRERAAKRLFRTILQPSVREVMALGGQERRQDFGEATPNRVPGEPFRGSLRERLRYVRHALWKEGAFALAFPMASRFVLPFWRIAMSVRALARTSAWWARHEGKGLLRAPLVGPPPSRPVER